MAASRLALAASACALAFAPAAAFVPNWTPTYEMSRSTIVQPCNSSGFFDPAFLGQFGVVDFDWSNGKQIWANASPMNCEELLLEQAAMLKAVNPETKVFVYRNLVKALPWYTSVRTKLQDPNYAGFFLPFRQDNVSVHVPKCDDNFDPPRCSDFYHDQDQTPRHPHGDGSCTAPCDCGEGVPCGEYLWNHKNGSMLRQFLVEEFILGPTGMANANVSGFYLDDGWTNYSATVLPWEPQPEGYCDHSPIGGATEEDYHCTEDMGLTQADTTAITEQWAQTIAAVQTAVVQAGGFTWQAFHTVSTPPAGNASTCAAFFRGACSPSSTTFTSAIQHALQWNRTSGVPTQLSQDLATFLLIRGPLAWQGYGWSGCTYDSRPGAGEAPYPYPAEWRVDYGQPVDTTQSCAETVPGSSGVFQREWTKASVSFDCNSWTGSITMK